MRPATCILPALALAVGLSGTAAADSHIRIPIDPKTLNVLPEGRVIPGPGVRVPLACSPDLAAFVEAHEREGGYDLIWGVRNVGASPYTSGSNQQMVTLSLGNSQVARLAFGNLSPGQRAADSKRIARPLEFPEQYVATLSFDPDIRIDGNPANDDCRASNDRAEATVGP